MLYRFLVVKVTFWSQKNFLRNVLEILCGESIASIQKCWKIFFDPELTIFCKIFSIILQKKSQIPGQKIFPVFKICATDSPHKNTSF